MINQLVLSKNYSLEEVLLFQENVKDKVLEMRSKFGMLLALGTSVKALTEVKDRNGKSLYYAEIKKKLDYDIEHEYVTHDIIIKVYEPKTFNHVLNEKASKGLNNAENYWKKHYENYLKSNSIYKGFPDMILDKF